MLKKNKRGWIKIVEAFIAILLIAGALLLVIDKGSIGDSSKSKQIYEDELSILRSIQLDDELRRDVLELQALPSCSSDKVNDYIESNAPDYLKCTSRVCNPDEICKSNEECYNTDLTEKEIYSKAIIISAEIDSGYRPRQLKLFCWVK